MSCGIVTVPKQVLTKQLMDPMICPAKNTGKLVDFSIYPILDPSAVIS